MITEVEAKIKIVEEFVVAADFRTTTMVVVVLIKEVPTMEVIFPISL